VGEVAVANQTAASEKKVDDHVGHLVAPPVALNCCGGTNVRLVVVIGTFVCVMFFVTKKDYEVNDTNSHDNFEDVQEVILEFRIG